MQDEEEPEEEEAEAATADGGVCLCCPKSPNPKNESVRGVRVKFLRLPKCSRSNVGCSFRSRRDCRNVPKVSPRPARSLEASPECSAKLWRTSGECLCRLSGESLAKVWRM